MEIQYLAGWFGWLEELFKGSLLIFFIVPTLILIFIFSSVIHNLFQILGLGIANNVVWSIIIKLLKLLIMPIILAVISFFHNINISISIKKLSCLRKQREVNYWSVRSGSKEYISLFSVLSSSDIFGK